MIFKYFLAFFAALSCLPVLAEEQLPMHPFLRDKFVLQAGVFFPNINRKGTLKGSSTVPIVPIDFERQFGLSDRQNIASADFQWRYHGNWSLRAQYFQIESSSSKTAQRQIEWGDATVEVGANVKLQTDLNVLRLFFARNFSSSPNKDYGIGIGLHRLGTAITLSGDLLVDGSPVLNGKRRVSLTAPLPNIGGWYLWSPSPRWVFGGRLDWLSGSLGSLSGGLTNAAVSASFQAFPNVGVGIKYQLLKLDLDIDKKNWNGSFRGQYDGLYLFLSAGWN